MTVTLGDHVNLLTGFPFKSARYSENPDDVLLLRGDNIGQGSLRWDGAKRWPKDALSDHTQFEVQCGDVVLAMDRPWIEAGLKWAWVRKRDEKMLLVQRVARMRGTNGLQTDYLRYVIASPQFTDHVLSVTTGVNVPHISGRDIKAFRFRLPPPDVQRRIAGVLSAYDDLIEVNTRRIVILEEMARRLFDEWFVKFRFPGYEATTFVKVGSALLPDGWRQVNLANVAEVNKDTLSPRNAPEIIYYIDISSVSPGTVNEIRTLSFADAPGRARRRITRGDILWSMVRPNRRSHALLLRVEPATIASTGFAVLRATAIPWSYLYQIVTTDRFVAFLEGRARGSAYPAVSASDFEDAKLYMPPKKLVDEFHRHAGPMFDLAAVLRQQNDGLRAARDLLLPNLLSGEIDLTRAERGLEAAADRAAAE